MTKDIKPLTTILKAIFQNSYKHKRSLINYKKVIKQREQQARRRNGGFSREVLLKNN